MKNGLNDGNLLRIVYLSRAHKDLGDDGLREILASSREFNAKNGISGILCHSFGYFLQVLEGPEVTLLKLYLRIVEDRRNTDSTLLQVVPIVVPMFKDWAMASLGEKDGITINFKDLLRARFNLAGDEATQTLMNRFLARVRAVDAN